MNDTQLLTLDLSQPRSSAQPTIPFGTATRPDGTTLTADGIGLVRNGRRWLATMGEFHYSRYAPDEWREELLKMRAGGIDIVATYIFWIHHEEIAGQWNWTGQRDLRAFVTLCRDLEMPIVLRCGPWAHGEARNGGLPDWLLDCDLKVRTNDPAYLVEAQRFYEQIAAQVAGLLWKSNGPIAGVQIENEYHGPAEHLLELKRLAVEAGLDAPLYTRTSWPELTTPMPFGHFLPLDGGYAEGFWDRDLSPMPGKYWREFVFKPGRENAAIATDHFGERQAGVDPDELRYPYLTCELGGGMMSSYHRRIVVKPTDVAAVPLVKVGSGSNLPGYYMYHGGTNPDGALTTLNEAQATRYTNHNDLPTKTYDFNAPLGEFGQLREHYHSLRRLHLFLRDFGEALASMPAFFPPTRAAAKTDTATLRWSARSDGHAGFVFVNNYQRGQPMPAKTGVQFSLGLSDGEMLCLPAEPITVPADTSFCWPFNAPLSDDVTLVYATAELVCRIDHDDGVTIVFAETVGVPAEFVFDGDDLAVETTGDVSKSADGVSIVRGVRPSTSAAITLRFADGRHCCIVLLDRTTSMTCWKGVLAGQERIVLTNNAIVFDGDQLRLRSADATTPLSLAVFPAPHTLTVAEGNIPGRPDGVFTRYAVPGPLIQMSKRKAVTEVVSAAGLLRDIRPGASNVAEAPSDAEFEDSAVWRIHLPADIDSGRRPILRLRYVGDVARLYEDGQLLDDNFYDGRAFEFGLWRAAPTNGPRELLLKILPLQKSPLIALPTGHRPDFRGATSVVRLETVEIIVSYEVEVRAVDVRAEAKS